MPSTPESDLYSTKEACAYLQIVVSTLRLHWQKENITPEYHFRGKQRRPFWTKGDLNRLRKKLKSRSAHKTKVHVPRSLVTDRAKFEKDRAATIEKMVESCGQIETPLDFTAKEIEGHIRAYFFDMAKRCNIFMVPFVEAMNPDANIRLKASIYVIDKFLPSLKSVEVRHAPDEKKEDQRDKALEILADIREGMAKRGNGIVEVKEIGD